MQLLNYLIIFIICFESDAYIIIPSLFQYHKHNHKIHNPINTLYSSILITTLYNTKQDNDNSMILRKIDKWACVKNCGACCKLGPLSSRPDLESYLTTDEFNKYKSMIGDDDWCKHFDQSTRMCTIYEDRPDFCRVEPKKFKKMYGIEEEELNDFCAFCCREQITDVYGEESNEMNSFEDVIDSLYDNDDN